MVGLGSCMGEWGRGAVGGGGVSGVAVVGVRV